MAKEDPMNATLISSRSAVCSTLALVLCLTGLKGGPGEGEGQEGPGTRAELRYVLTVPVREGKEDEAQALATRQITYLKANHDGLAEFLGFANWSPHFRWATFVYSLPDALSTELLFSRLANEEGWRALQDEMEGAFEMEAGRRSFMIPVTPTDAPHERGGFLWFRTAEVLPDRLAGVLLLARAEAKYVNEKYGQGLIQVYSGIREGVGRIFWFGEFANSDAWRDVQAGLWSDTAYLELMEQAEGRFVEGSWSESLEMLTQS
jgi:hypothetical protein